mmetsp:Transcript_72854/g.204636  ORF Transcript_72854/g.204636 Transcript_72854/m.204636 type:complete len:212 (+) Transcript_72854:386-1021(+)
MWSAALGHGHAAQPAGCCDGFAVGSRRSSLCSSAIGAARTGPRPRFSSSWPWPPRRRGIACRCTVACGDGESPGGGGGYCRCASSASSASLAPPSRCPCCGRCAPRPPKARQAVARVRGVPRAVPSRPGPLCGRKWPLALRRGTVSPVASRVVWRGFVEQPYCLGQRERLRCGPRPGCCACRRAILHVSRPVSRRLGKEAASDSLCRWRAA